MARKWCKWPNIRGTSNGRSPEYRAWKSIRARCYSRRNDHYRYYGGRGIKVCDRWRDSFEAFLEDMGPRPEGHSIHRINNDGNYEPGNCRWATNEEQARNKSNNVIIELDGIRKTAADWAQELGLDMSTLCKRIKRGMPPADALAPVIQDRSERGTKKAWTLNGETMPLRRWAERFGMKYALVKHRVQQLEWPLDRALIVPPGASSRWHKFSGGANGRRQ